MKKNIAIVTQHMMIGGIEKALLSMIEYIPKHKYNVTLFIMTRGGELEKGIPEWVKIISVYGEENTIKEKLINSIKNKKILRGMRIAIYMPLSILSKNEDRQKYYISKTIEKVDIEYDIAISYHNLFTFSVEYVANFLKAKRKIVWGHADVRAYISEIEKNRKYYEKFNDIFLVSKEAKNEFLKLYPELSYKTAVFYNTISKSKLEKMAQTGETFEDNFNGIRILTIGRLVNEKSQKIIPEIMMKLKNNNKAIRWYLIGDGEDREYIKNKIREFKLENDVILLGIKYNPYKYLKDCDIYVQPSQNECYCTSIMEAKCLKKPIVATDVNGVNEQIINNKNGLIVKYNIDSICIGIKKLIDNNQLRDRIVSKLKSETIETVDEIKKIL